MKSFITPVLVVLALIIAPATGQAAEPILLAQAKSAPIDINRAKADELMTLKGIGEARAEIELSERHMPFFLSGLTLANATFDVVLHLNKGVTVTEAFTLQFDSQALGGAGGANPFVDDASTPLKRATATTSVPVLQQHTLSVVNLGTLGSTTSGVPLDETRLLDVLLRVALKKKTP